MHTQAGVRKQRGQWTLPSLVIALIGCLLWQPTVTAQAKEVRRVLILNVFDPLSSPGVAALDQGIMASLESSPYQIELYSEDLEMTLFPDEAHQQQFRGWYTRKYHDRKPDVIIAVGLEPLKFMVESHQKSFPGVPVIFCGATKEMLGQLKLDSDFTGVWEVAQPERTLNVALRLQPGTKHVVVVGGVGPYDRYLEAIARESFRKYEARFDFLYLTDLDMPTLLERLKHLPDHTIVYHTSIMQDAAGTRFIDATQSVPLIASTSSAPVFVVDDVDLGRGTAGGNLLSFASDGRLVGEMAVRVLHGERPQDVPIVGSKNVYMFDWRALQRWGLKESALPPGSIVLNRQPTVWESLKWYILGSFALILLEALLIGGLVWQRARRRKAEAELVISYERLRMAVEAARFVGWDFDLNSGQNLWFGDLEYMLGIRSDNYSAQTGEFSRRVYPEDRSFVLPAIADARQSRQPYITEFRFLRNDGTVRWVNARGKFYYASDGVPERMLGLAVDITERKMAEDALMSLSARLIEAQEEERKRIARELHDDYNQRLAMLAIELEKLAEDIGESSVEGQRLHEFFDRVSELGADLHSLSHSLHSSTLESLGLVAGVRAFCEEFAEQQHIQVDFVHENVPRGIPADAALCLFRVAQEALRNIKRHSSADRAEVRLEWKDEKLHLSVSDQGRGFELSKASANRGIGIRSMEERLRVLGGHLEIESRPLEGTRIDASLPFKIARHRAG